jgi:hypothetical protein
MKHTLTAVSSLLAALMVLMHAVPIPAEETSVGVITEARGTVMVTRSDGRKIGAQQNLPLLPGDTIATGTDGIVSFAFHTGDIFTLNADSQVSLDELSASGEDTPPVLRLALGFLWSKIKPYLNKELRPMIHTPTAVVGVRGTEFDTVVAEDSASAIAVDQGSVEIESEEEVLVLNQGYSTEVDPDEKILPPEKAVQRDLRDWQKFRKERAEKLVAHLPRNAPRIRMRFERDVNRYLNFTQRINVPADRINDHIRQFYDAWGKRDRTTAQKQLQEIRSLEAEFRPMALQFRKALNRVQVIGINALNLKTVLLKNRHRFSASELAVIKQNLSGISEKLVQMKEASGLTVAKIRQTYKNLIKIRETAKQHRKGTK